MEIRGDRVYVLDTTSLLAALPLQLYNAILVTTPSTISEVRDRENFEKTNLSLSIGRIKILKPEKSYVDIVREKALAIGEHTLSNTDIEIAALALQVSKECREHEDIEVVVMTDDYSLQNLLSHIGLEFMPLRTKGIREKRRYIVICPACGYRAKSISEKYCPVCGTKLVKRRAK